ncbi:hypothetical protein NDU88_001090 [Pleurodeles waltl]|uniref:Uncharacterized protein n=1 Tax=Pleurodeles waltl TaxID=8319 RepID=A0AAV7WHC0_PLEWA|nr:hypothetical protein NDU88_001090 [Pleurodeles waltl]
MAVKTCYYVQMDSANAFYTDDSLRGCRVSGREGSAQGYFAACGVCARRGGVFQNAPCQEDEDSVGKKKEEDRNVRQVGSRKGEVKSQPGDGGTQRQEEEVPPGYAELLAQGGELPLGSSEGNHRQETKEGEDALEPATF